METVILRTVQVRKFGNNERANEEMLYRRSVKFVECVDALVRHEDHAYKKALIEYKSSMARSYA